MTELLQIRDFIQQITEGISLASEIDTQVIDCYCNRIAGTVYHPLPSVGGVVRDVLKTGKPRILTSPFTDPACSSCEKRSYCEEKGFIHYPIFYDGKVVGVMGLICFDQIQAKKISDEKHRLSSFVERMCEIIQLKLKEYDVTLKEKELLQETLLQNQFLNQTINQISDGYLFVNKDGTIRNYNTPALRILGVNAQTIQKETIYSLIPDPALKDLFLQKSHTIYQQVLIHNRKYGIFISFFYNENELMGCSINFKAIDRSETNFESFRHSTVTTALTLEAYLGEGKEMQKIKKLAQKAISQPVNVLIFGENGTGKETLARAIHGSSRRSKNPFVVVDCQTLSPEEVDKELFGRTSPAGDSPFPEGDRPGFGEDSSVRSSASGKLELARTGTIFFNNADQLPLYSQRKLLSLLKTGVSMDVRIIAASTQPLKELIAKEVFLEELYYRLNGIPIYLPPLRDRGSDIMLYASHMLKKYQKYFSDRSFRFDKKISLYFSHYSWPGNLHEMENVVQYMLSIYDGKGSLISVEHLPANIRESFEHFDVPEKISRTVSAGTGSLRSIENQTIQDLLKQYGSSTLDKKIVAQKLGISLATLYRRLRENK